MLRELKWQLKKWFKKNQVLANCLHKLLFIYLKIVYKTSRLNITYQDQKNNLDNKGKIYALWHNRLVCGSSIFENHQSSSNNFKGAYVLISPHNDGKIISKIIHDFGLNVLEGSSNKNSTNVLRQIISKLSEKASIIITPDGPRGPLYTINSNITELARKYNANLIPVSCISSRFFSLKSWDKLIVPLPFGSIYVIIGSPLILSADKKTNDDNLVSKLNVLARLAEDYAKNR